MNFIKKILH